MVEPIALVNPRVKKFAMNNHALLIACGENLNGLSAQKLVEEVFKLGKEELFKRHSMVVITAQARLSLKNLALKDYHYVLYQVSTYIRCELLYSNVEQNSNAECNAIDQNTL